MAGVQVRPKGLSTPPRGNLAVRRTGGARAEARFRCGEEVGDLSSGRIEAEWRKGGERGWGLVTTRAAGRVAQIRGPFVVEAVGTCPWVQDRAEERRERGEGHPGDVGGGPAIPHEPRDQSPLATFRMPHAMYSPRGQGTPGNTGGVFTGLVVRRLTVTGPKCRGGGRGITERGAGSADSRVSKVAKGMETMCVPEL